MPTADSDDLPSNESCAWGSKKGYSFSDFTRFTKTPHGDISLIEFKNILWELE
jgi:hypothetical protein